MDSSSQNFNIETELLNMEGLIPFLFHKIKKTRAEKGYQGLSTGSSHGGSYRQLIDRRSTEQMEGSSHRRVRSDFPAVSYSVFPDRVTAAAASRSHR
ncbi:hypothetical protein QJS10_CPA05g01220 [Acorus calamus]|uniref:Uncharacterized protein n=1 Tax=Acorus calamus TaxID=4465 RepID=A0AAV9EYH7_ACOCL|nr:hypothetical protein QJS10_CPA05g01220 [Acorus calamus]